MKLPRTDADVLEALPNTAYTFDEVRVLRLHKSRPTEVVDSDLVDNWLKKYGVEDEETLVKLLNDALGITLQQAIALRWYVETAGQITPLCDPVNYNEEGRYRPGFDSYASAREVDDDRKAKARRKHKEARNMYANYRYRLGKLYLSTQMKINLKVSLPTTADAYRAKIILGPLTPERQIPKNVSQKHLEELYDLGFYFDEDNNLVFVNAQSWK